MFLATLWHSEILTTRVTKISRSYTCWRRYALHWVLLLLLLCLNIQYLHIMITQMRACFSHCNDHHNYHVNVNWDMVSRNDLDKYCMITDQFLSRKLSYVLKVLRVPMGLVQMRIISMISILCIILSVFSKLLILASLTQKREETIMPISFLDGMIMYQIYIVLLEKCSFLWKVNGKPRNGALYEAMKTSRSRFKLALRICKANGNQMRADSMAHYKSIVT